MSASTTTSVAYIYKRMYSDPQIADHTLRDHPLSAMLHKEGNFGGEDFRYPVRYGNPQGVSGTFADAQSGAASSKGAVFACTPALKYGVITLDGPSLVRAKPNKAAFLDLVTQETDGILDALGDSLAFDLYGLGDGNRGRRSSAATNVITLTASADARNFKPGMTVIASANADGSSERTGNTTVASVDESSGTITLTSAAAITSFANNDYLFRLGDPGTCADGLQSIIPLVAPVYLTDSFRGVDRGLEVVRLSGSRIDDTDTAIEENCGLLGVNISSTGKRADCVFWNPMNFWQVARRLNAKVEYSGGGGKADYGFQYISIHTPAGTLKAFSDPDCPTNKQWVGNMKNAYVKHTEPYPHIIRDDGRPSLRETSSDGVETRARCMSNFIITVPGSWGVASI